MASVLCIIQEAKELVIEKTYNNIQQQKATSGF